jgi:hypothetical protein
MHARVDCSGVQRRTRKVGALGGIKSPKDLDPRGARPKQGCLQERVDVQCNHSQVT